MHREVLSWEGTKTGHARAGRCSSSIDLTPRGQEVTASGLEDWPVRDWLVLALGGVEARKGGGGGGCSALGDPLVTDT